MAQATALSVGVVDSTVDGLRQRLLLEIQGMDGRDYILAPTEKGKTEAANRAAALLYAGAAPVSLDVYTATVESQRGRAPINAATLEEAFNDLIIPPGFFDELGPALVSKGAVFLYGPPGTGKTSLAERMIKMYKDPVLVPRAVEFDQSVITVFDHRFTSRSPLNLKALTPVGCSACLRASSLVVSSPANSSNLNEIHRLVCTGLRCR